MSRRAIFSGHRWSTSRRRFSTTSAFRSPATSTALRGPTFSPATLPRTVRLRSSRSTNDDGASRGLSAKAMWSRGELARDFRALGIVAGDVVMLHASVRSVGETAGGPDQIHLALRDALGAAGTLMMYVGCPDYYDDVGRGVLTLEQEREVLEKQPAFDALTTRSARAHGILVEFFRTFPGTVVNHHVARFAAAGEHADRLTAEHPWNLPYGTHSPLDRFRALGGQILLLGSDHDEVTFLHHVEHTVPFAGKKIARYRV